MTFSWREKVDETAGGALGRSSSYVSVEGDLRGLHNLLPEINLCVTPLIASLLPVSLIDL